MMVSLFSLHIMAGRELNGLGMMVLLHWKLNCYPCPGDFWLRMKERGVDGVEDMVDGIWNGMDIL